MKTIMMFVVGMMISTNSFAQGILNSETCNNLEEIAGVVMQKRQEGFSMKIIMDAANPDSGTLVGEAVTMIIKGAYSQPKYSDPDIQNQVVMEYRNQWYLDCISLVD